LGPRFRVTVLLNITTILRREAPYAWKHSDSDHMHISMHHLVSSNDTKVPPNVYVPSHSLQVTGE